MPTAAPKRTRRVANPFDAKLEVRLYSTEKAKLVEEAAARGMSASDLVRSKLGHLIKAEPPQAAERPEKPEPVPTPPEPPAEPQALTSGPESVDTALYLAERFHESPGYMKLKLRAGRIFVDGEQWNEPMIPVELAERAELQTSTYPYQRRGLPIRAPEQEPAGDGEQDPERRSDNGETDAGEDPEVAE